MEMKTLLEQVNKGESSIAILREAHQKEHDRLGDIRETAMSHEKGWLGTADALVGDTQEERVKNFGERMDELAAAEKFLHEHDQTILKAQNLRQTPQAPQTAETKAGFPQSGPPIRVELERPRTFSQKMLELPQFKERIPDGRLPNPKEKNLMGGNHVYLRMPAQDAMPVFKAFQITTPLPTDVVGRAYPMRTQPLDYITMRTAPGALIFYHQPQVPAAADPGSNSNRAQTRMRGAELNEVTVEWARVSLEKTSQGSWMPIDYEDINDNAEVMTQATEQLLIDCRYLMVQQLFNGTNVAGSATHPEWNGILRLLTDDAGVDQTRQAVPTPGTDPDATHPLMVLEQAFISIWNRGMFPTVIFVGATDYVKITAQQRVERYLETDYGTFPMGSVRGIPLCLTDQLPANNILVGDCGAENIEIVLGQEIETMMSDDYRFANNQRAIRVVVYGNIPIYRPLAFRRIIDTNNLRVVRPG